MAQNVRSSTRFQEQFGPDLEIRNLVVTGELTGDDGADAVVAADISGNAATATLAAEATTVTGLTFPIELAEAAVEAADLWTALAAAGIIVEPA